MPTSKGPILPPGGPTGPIGPGGPPVLGPVGKFIQELAVGENYQSAICGQSDSSWAGVWGISQGPAGEGVKGNGVTGVHGVATDAGRHGVLGEGLIGVRGMGKTADGEGVLGEGKNGVHGRSHSPTDSGVWGENIGGGYGVSGSTGGATAAGVWGVNTGGGPGVQGSGSSGPGVNAVSGSGAGIHATGTPAGYFEGDVEVLGNVTVGGDVILSNKDCAEDFEMAVGVEPGVVVVIDPSGILKQCDAAYDKRVAGVVSGAGDYRPGIILGRTPAAANTLPVALAGRVHCKVDAQYAPIEVGDLLTTSPTPGHAMLAGDGARAFGTVIGKALQPLAVGRGLIPILVALQ